MSQDSLETNRKLSVRKAVEQDIPALQKLLEQVNLVHHLGRPDLFNLTTKYSVEDLTSLLTQEHFPVFVAEDDQGKVLGHAFCQIIEHKGERLLADIKTLYIDDICVDEAARHKKVGSQLYNYVIDFAKNIGCYNVTLNVWSCNPGACEFYKQCGLEIQKYGMEKILK
ncbi:MAG: GNAT family N-acetyltransferase [Desulfovibrionaceae bacterium]|nr:GNAT family N-acetyltransferase [Desulfovibrionaceae bacterium]